MKDKKKDKKKNFEFLAKSIQYPSKKNTTFSSGYITNYKENIEFIESDNRTSETKKKSSPLINFKKFSTEKDIKKTDIHLTYLDKFKETHIPFKTKKSLFEPLSLEETINYNDLNSEKTIDYNLNSEKTIDYNLNSEKTIDYNLNSEKTQDYNLNLEKTINYAECKTSSLNKEEEILNKPSSISGKDPLNLLGKLLVGKYEILKFLGQGGMGAVYMARHKILGKERALKFLVKSSNLKKEDIKRFINEARAAAKVEHPNIVQVYDIEETDEFYFIIMQFVEGKSINFIIEENGPFEPILATKIIISAAKGLSEIHKAGLIHRDIKPANIMLSIKGEVKIMDFGIVKDICCPDQGLTATGAIIGTPQFMSPEQITKQGLDNRSDLYSLGATFYFMLTNQPCFSGNTMQLLYQIINTPPIPPHEINPKIDLELSRIILKMLEKKPSNRYPDMESLIEELENYIKKSI